MSSSPANPLILCYDGSAHAKHAIEYAGRMFRDGYALVLTVWQPTSGLGSLAWAGATERMDNFVEFDRAAADNAGSIAEEGARIARLAGLGAKPISVEAAGPVWKSIIDVADSNHAVMIVMGSRGYSAISSLLLGSVSNAVVHHANQPTLVIHGRDDDESHAEAAIAAAA